MKRPLLIQTVASSLIGLMAFNSLAWVPQAFADDRLSVPSYTISFDFPDHGMIDMYHQAFSAVDHVSNSLYLLRNTAVEDLLNTRRSLKVLLGGTNRAKEVSGDTNLSFDVPGGIVDLYLLGQLDPSQAVSTGSDQASTTGDVGASSVQPQAHSADPDSVPQIARAIHWIGGNEPPYDQVLRLKLLAGLAWVSAQLTKADQGLKFLQEDFWIDSAISQEFRKEEIEPVEQAQALGGGGMVGVDTTTLHTLQSLWLSRHHMKDVINVLAGHREYLLDRYHLLGVEVDGQPLYKYIYKAMEAQGFPAADMVQPPIDKSLPQGEAPIQLATAFDDALGVAFNRLTDQSAKDNFLKGIYDNANRQVDLALIESLKANTERLSELASQIDYTGDRSSPLIELAKYDDLWDATIAKYGYLTGIVDLYKAREEISGYWDRRETTNRHLRYAAYGVGIGIGIAAIVFTGGAAAEGGAVVAEGGEAGAAALSALGIPLRSWLIGAGMVADAGMSVDLYVDSAEASKVAKGLYLGTVQQGSNADMRNMAEMKDSDFHLMLGSLIVLGLSSANLARLAVSRLMVARNGITLVELGEEDITVLRKAVQELSDRAENLAPMGRALLSTVERMLGMAVNENQLQELGQAVNALAKELNTSPSAIFTKLESAPGLGQLIRGWRARQLTSRILIASNILKRLTGADANAAVGSSFGRFMAEQQVNNFLVSVVAESLARGKKMLGSERGEFIGDMVRGTLITAVLCWTGVSSDALGAADGITAQAGDPELKVIGGFAGGKWNKIFQEAKDVAKAGVTNATVGMIINGVSDGTSQAIQFVEDRDKPGAPSAKDRFWHVAKGTLWNGLSLGISSTLRYRYFLRWAEKTIATNVAEGPGRTILIQGASTANNLFGGWSYVSAGQYLGFLTSGGEKVPDEGQDNGGPLPDIATLQVGDITPAYFRVSGDATAAGYMFDFLRGGDQAAGPQPVLQ